MADIAQERYAEAPLTPGLRQRLANCGFDGVTLLILPALLFVIGVFIYPFLYGLVLSFNPLDGGGAFANYVKFFSDPFLYKTIGACGLPFRLRLSACCLRCRLPYAFD
jgi:putative spermidine/putrescine transport system permease protein